MYFKVPINIPAGIRYISQWGGFDLSTYKGHNIIHKQLPGCGFTELTLTCSLPVVLCSPRKMLMQNKEEQHKGDVYLVKSKFDKSLEVDEDINRSCPSSVITKSIKEDEFRMTLESQIQEQQEEQTFYSELFGEISKYFQSLIGTEKTPKIIVTYDSAYLVKRVLEQMGIIDQFLFVVDEFQSLMEDARFKADTESNFLSVTLQQIPNVLYVSATPMLDKYIRKIPELNLPYYEMDWGALEPSRIKRPDLKVRTMNSVSKKMEEIVCSYLDGNFERVIVDRGDIIGLQEVISSEAVLYVNSVNHIINLIKKFKDGFELKDKRGKLIKKYPPVTPEMVNILCSDTPENQKRLEVKLGKDSGFTIGRVPLRGEPHKMFTFCTRTVYLGADFYSTCAKSFIFSDANSDCLSVDISMDLAQILGRQRLLENPWHNSADFYYKATADYRKMKWEDFKKIIDLKEEETKNLLSHWEKGTDVERQATAKKLLTDVKANRYKGDYVGVNRLDDNTLLPQKNNLVVINEERSFDIQQVDYANRFSVFCSIEREFGVNNSSDSLVSNFFSVYDSIDTYIDKIKMICEFIIKYPELKDYVLSNLSDSDKIKQQLVSLNAEKIKGLGYNITRIREAMGIVIFDKRTFLSSILKNFTIGSKYTNKYIKDKLYDIYEAADYQGKAKASDLSEWFEVKPCKVSTDNGRENGLEILSIK